MTKAVIKNSSGRIVDSSNDIILNRIKSGENGGELYTTKYERYHTSFAFGCAARLVRLFKDDTTKIREFLNCSGVCYHFGHTTPLARLVYDYDDCDGTISGVKVQVFENITLDVARINSALNVVWWGHTSVLETFMNKVDEGKSSEHGEHRWGTTDKTWRTIKKSKTISLGRYLSTYADVVRASDHERVRSEMMPVVPYFPQTLAEYISVYESGPQSCMKSTSRHAEDWSEKYHDTKDDAIPMHPIVWYFYNPSSTLLAFKRGKNIVGRCILWKAARSDKRYHTKLYHDTDGIYQHMALYFRQNNVYSYARHALSMVKFSMPSPTSYSGFCTIPYMDGLESPYNATYNKTSGKFKFTPNRTGCDSNVNWLSTKGYTTGDYINTPRCDECNGRCSSYSIDTLDGHIFCDTSCANHAGYVNAYRSSTETIMVHKSVAVQDSLNCNEFFENMRVAETLGIPVLDNCISSVEEGNTSYTSFGVDVMCNGLKYRASSRVLRNGRDSGTVTINRDDSIHYFTPVKLNIAINIRASNSQMILER
tara:strand:+ start:1837 stop:3447 length:1611 start_codon:yes stop_codon:yes gene_type:complete